MPVALLAAVCTLAAWQAVILVALLVAAATARRQRRLALAVGAASGLAVVLVGAWATWAAGSLDDLREAVAFRAGTGEKEVVTIPAMLRAQGTYLADVLPLSLAVLAPVAFAVALRDPRTRLTAAVTVVTPVAYCLLLPGGAYYHAYWAYWLLPGLAVVSAAGVDRLHVALCRRGAHPRFVAAALAVGSLLAGTTGGLRPSAQRADFERAAAVGRMVRDLGPRTSCLPTTATIVAPATWVWFETGAPACRTAGPPPPGTPVLVAEEQLRTGPPWVRRAQVLARADPYAVIRVGG